MANVLRRFAKRFSTSTGSASTTSTKSKSTGEAVTSPSTNHMRPSSSRSLPKLNKKFQWMKKLFTRKVSPQNTKNELESANHEWINSSDSSLAIVNEIMSPEYATTGSIHSYISSSDDECVGRIITLPVFSVTQSITDIHNTCILEWDSDRYTKREESEELIDNMVHSK